VKIHPYPTPAEQFYRARFARARISRALHGGKSWQIWVSNADTPLSVTLRATLQSALCASSQFENPAWRKTLLRFSYPVQVLHYPPHAKQPYRAHYARARNSIAPQGGKRWPIWLSSANTPLSANRKAILLSANCASSQFASPAWRKSLPNLGIQCRYSHIRHPQRNPTERVMRELAFREPCMAERFPI
jgi:hypothetical protein